MSKTLIINIASNPVAFPAGTAPTGISITLSGGAHAPQTISAAPYSATFADVQPGVYSATAQAIDVNGSALGSAIVSAEFTIEADPIDTVNVDIQVSITISVA